MTLARLNLLTAVLSFAFAIVWSLMGDTFAGLIWMGVSAVWLVLALLSVGRVEREQSPARRIALRFSRLMRWM